MQALKLRLALKEELERFLEKYDALITPPTTGEAPATLEQTGIPCFCSIWSLCGVPAVTIPVAFGPQGLPLGLQIVGMQGKDEWVLSTAHWCERLFSFPCWMESHESPRPFGETTVPLNGGLARIDQQCLLKGCRT
jgi:Asp-tRNA(Asn)/Glu-tRNA(Gln) amidotransferase A subunit family amidase